MAFKVKYRTRNKLQRAIQQEISKLGLIDDGTMRSSIRVSSVSGDVGNIVITVNCIYYYVFQDLGANLWNGGTIRKHDITARALKTPKGQQFIEEVYQAYVSWIDEKYEILDSAKLVVEYMDLQYNVFGGGAEGYPDGIYDPNVRLKV